VEALPAEIALSLSESMDEASLKCSFNEAIFDRAAVRRLLGHLQVILEQVVEKPETRISQISILSPAEVQQVVHDWNKTSRDYPSDQSYNKLFEQQVGVILKRQPFDSAAAN